MKSTTIVTALASSMLMWVPIASANDTNHTGQSQTDDAGKASTGPEGADANTMAGGNATATSVSQEPQQQSAQEESPGEAKMNAEKKSAPYEALTRIPP